LREEFYVKEHVIIILLTILNLITKNIKNVTKCQEENRKKIEKCKKYNMI